jgi:hypothetical protein
MKTRSAKIWNPTGLVRLETHSTTKIRRALPMCMSRQVGLTHWNAIADALDRRCTSSARPKSLGHGPLGSRHTTKLRRQRLTLAVMALPLSWPMSTAQATTTYCYTGRTSDDSTGTLTDDSLLGSQAVDRAVFADLQVPDSSYALHKSRRVAKPKGIAQLRLVRKVNE